MVHGRAAVETPLARVPPRNSVASEGELAAPALGLSLNQWGERVLAKATVRG